MRTRIILAVTLAISVSANLWLFLLVREAEHQRLVADSFGTALIDRSIVDYASRTHQTPDDVLRGYTAEVAVTADATCVNLRPKPNVLAATHIYCYADDGRQAYRGDLVASGRVENP